MMQPQQPPPDGTEDLQLGRNPPLPDGALQQQDGGGDEQPKKKRRRRKGPVGDINVALYIKQQQSRGSSRKWRQEWVRVRTIIGGGEVKILKWVTDTPPAAAPTAQVSGFANFQSFAQSRPRKPAAAPSDSKEAQAAGADKQQGKPGALSRPASTLSLDQSAANQPPKKKAKKSSQQQPAQPVSAAASAAAGGAHAEVPAAAAAGGADVQEYQPLPYPKRRRTTTRRPAKWVSNCSCFPLLDVGASEGGKAAGPASSAAAAGGSAHDIKSLAASIAASIAANVHADSSAPSAGAVPAALIAGEKAPAKVGKKRKSSAADAEGGAASTAAAAGSTPAVEAVTVGPPGAERFACSVCGRDFATQGALRIHSNVHATKNFACTFPGCKKAFADAKKLEKHAKKHAAAAALLSDSAAAAGGLDAADEDE